MHLTFAGKLTGRVTKWIVLVAWIFIVAFMGSLAGKLADVQENDVAAWLPASADSTQVIEELSGYQDPDEIPTLVVYSSDTAFTKAQRAAITADLPRFAELKGAVPGIEGPIFSAVSDKGQAAEVVVTFNHGKNGWEPMVDSAKELREIAGETGLTVEIAGSGGQAADSAEAFAGIDGRLLLIAGVAVILILLITYRSPLLWLLPFLSTLFALATAQGAVYLAAKYAGVTVNGQSQGILSVLVFGVSTDYALLLVARYREELRNHEDRHEAMAFALHRAAPAILASAATVIIGMLVLLFAEMNSTAGLGPVTAIGVLAGFLVMVTLLPALLVIFGRWIFWPLRPGFGTKEPTASGFWARLGERIARNPRRVWVVTVAILAAAWFGISSVSAVGLTSEETYTKQVESVTGTETLAEHGLIDTSTPLQVIVPADRADDAVEALGTVKGLGPVATPVPLGDDVLIEAPVDYEYSTEQSQHVVDDARDAVHGAVEGSLVGGYPAVWKDIITASQRDNLVIIPLVLLVVLVILVALLRSLVAPLLLMGTVVLSFGAALGVSNLVFSNFFDYHHADSAHPLFVFMFLVALGIDYNIFLMTRIHEETKTQGTRKGTLVGLAATGGVITSAGMVLAATFLALASLPLVGLVQMGVTVAVGVVLDTFIVRSVLVTALNLDLGSKIWWPSKLDRDPVVVPTDNAGV